MGRPPNQFPPEVVTAVLTDLVAAGGVAKRIEKKWEGTVTYQTICQWKRETHFAQYREIEERYGRELEELLVVQARANAMRAGEIEAELIEKMLTVEGRDAPQALRAITDAKTKNVDKMLSLTGRPSQITESRDMGAILESLARLNVIKVVEPAAIDGSAVEEEAQ